MKTLYVLVVVQVWAESVRPSVELVPTLLFRTYNASEGIDPFGGKLNFDAGHSNATLRAMLDTFTEINPARLGVFDVYPNRDQGSGPALAVDRGLALTRIGLQPTETLPSLYAGGGVVDTWSAVCCGKTNDLWSTLPCGAPTLRQWLATRRKEDARPFAFDMIVVAWDYNLTVNGTNPGIDDATKNQALPVGRAALVAQEIARAEQQRDRDGDRSSVSAVLDDRQKTFGLSSDLTILEADGRVPQRDGPDASIYATLRAGSVYWAPRSSGVAPGATTVSFFGEAFREVVEQYRVAAAAAITTTADSAVSPRPAVPLPAVLQRDRSSGLAPGEAPFFPFVAKWRGLHGHAVGLCTAELIAPLWVVTAGHCAARMVRLPNLR